MREVALFMDGKETRASKSATILDVAIKNDVEIPTLCHHPMLSRGGYCRICVVEDRKSGKLLTACDTYVTDGMDISTDSKRVAEARKRTLKLILANHPETCVICEKGNSCKLRGLASRYGLFLSSRSRVGHLNAIVDANPFIHRDLSKCIGCQLCTRACRELQGAEAIEFTEVSLKAKPETSMNTELSGSTCELCGLCVSLCPVGALIEKPGVHAAFSDRRSPIICPYCGVGCSLYLDIKDNRILGVEAGVPNSVNGSSLCAKGRYGLDFINHRERLNKPLIRQDGDLIETDWDTAMVKVSEGLKNSISQYGPDSIGIVTSAKISNEENYLLQKLARAAIGTNNVDHCARL